MFIAYFVLFVIFNGRLTVETAVFGLVFAALLYAFSCRFLGYSIQKDMNMVRGAGDGLRYLGMLAAEIVKANCRVIRMILTPGFEPKPQLIQFHSGLSDDGHLVVLADSITLTPGTITCDLEGEMLTVHCLDRTQREGIETSCFVTKLKEMEAKAESCRAASESDTAVPENNEMPKLTDIEANPVDENLPENDEIAEADKLAVTPADDDLCGSDETAEADEPAVTPADDDACGSDETAEAEEPAVNPMDENLSENDETAEADEPVTNPVDNDLPENGETAEAEEPAVTPVDDDLCGSDETAEADESAENPADDDLPENGEAAETDESEDSGLTDEEGEQ